MNKKDNDSQNDKGSDDFEEADGFQIFKGSQKKHAADLDDADDDTDLDDMAVPQSLKAAANDEIRKTIEQITRKAVQQALKKYTS